MKQSIRLSLLMMLAVLSLNVYSQSSNNEDGVVKIEPHNRDAYREGEVIVKLHSETSAKMQAPARGKKYVTAGLSQLDAVLQEIGAVETEPLMPLTGHRVVSKRMRAVNGAEVKSVDLQKLYRLRIDQEKHLSVFEAVEKLNTLAEVEYAEPNYVVYALANDYQTYSREPLYSQQWGPAAIGLPQLWQQPKITTKRPIIAILDTGVDTEHPDLAANIWTNQREADGLSNQDDDNNGFKDDVHGWDFVNQTGKIGDYNGHGTHCAGIAAAVGNNGIGITGANPDALIMPVTIMQSDGTGDVATIIRGIDYAVANGADILSMSFGSYSNSIAEEQALARAYSSAILVAAAGNDYKCIIPHSCPTNGMSAYYNGPMFPAAFTFVIGVEASADSDGTLASFSNFDGDGSNFSAYGEEKLYNYELMAPGYRIASTWPNGKYKLLSGTSMACPLMAGAISRLLQCKEYSSTEQLLSDFVNTRKATSKGKPGNNDVYAAYRVKDTDRKPYLYTITYEIDDSAGDGDGRVDAGETIALYPTYRNNWGQAENIQFWLTLAENEDPNIVTLSTERVSFEKPLSSYAKAKSKNPIIFTVNKDCVDGRRIRLMLNATCDGMQGVESQEIELTVENGVELNGILKEDLTLYPDVHYIINSTFAVPKGVTLTIKPGTVVKVKDGVLIKIEGIINAIGKPDSLITFTKTDLGTNWRGIQVSNEPNDASIMSYCFIEYIHGIFTWSYGNYDNIVFKNNNFSSIKSDGLGFSGYRCNYTQNTIYNDADENNISYYSGNYTENTNNYTILTYYPKKWFFVYI